MIVIILPLNFIGRKFIIILVPDNGLYFCYLFVFVHLVFSKLRLCTFPFLFLFLSVQFLVWFFGLLGSFYENGPDFCKLTIFIETLSTFCGRVDIAITLYFP
jgi:hypothetical protein